MSVSIHVGSQIIVVPRTPQTPDSGAGHSVPAGGSTTPTSANGKSVSASADVIFKDKNKITIQTIEQKQKSLPALDFSISWMKFINEVDEEYLKRVSRNDKQQPLSVFDVNVDLFESYLLKVSGKELSAVQHLNLNINSALIAHLKIFDTQQYDELPEEMDPEKEKAEELARRRALRHKRFMKRRRITASFHEHDEGTMEASIQRDDYSDVPTLPPNKNFKGPLQDSLNDRSDDEDDSQLKINDKTQDSHEEFDREVHTINHEPQIIVQQAEQFNSLMMPRQHDQASFAQPPSMTNVGISSNSVNELDVQQPHHSRSIDEGRDGGGQHTLTTKSAQNHDTMRDFRTSFLHPESVIKSEDDHNLENAKVKIGDQSIDANFDDIDNPQVHNYEEHDDDILNEEDLIRDQENPFREKAVGSFQKQSIVSQQSLESKEATLRLQQQQLTDSSAGGSTGEHRNTFELVAKLADLDPPTNPDAALNIQETEVQQQPIQEPPIVVSSPAKIQQQAEPANDKVNVQVTQLPHQTQFTIQQQEFSIVPQDKQAVEPEVVLRFEVAVGETPQITSLQHDDKNVLFAVPATVDMAVGGNTPLGDAQEEDFPNGEAPKIERSVGEEEDNNNAEEEDQEREAEYQGNQENGSLINMSMEGGDLNQSKHASRLEVTLTAEPDKPIMLEVRGGEKQFLISALTKHIYEILSQPHRLQMLREQEQEEREAEEQDQEQLNQYEAVDPAPSQQQFTVQPTHMNGKNINLKLKSLKKNLQITQNGSSLPMLRNSSKQNQEIQTRNEVLSTLPGLQNQAITIEEFENSQVVKNEQPNSNLPRITQNKTQNNPQQRMKSGTNSRPNSGGKARSPMMLNSVVEDKNGKRPQLLKPGTSDNLVVSQKRSERDMLKYDQISKRTTEEAYADAKIREETRLTHVYDSDPSIFAKETGLLNSRSGRRETVSEKRFGRGSIVNRDSQGSQEQIRSRPETANFNNDQYQELPPINIKSSQISGNTRHSQIRTPKQLEGDVILNIGTKPRISRRALTPENHSHDNISPEMQHSTPAEAEQFSLPPLQPTIPMPHPNGYFQPDSDPLRNDSQTFGNSMNSENQGDYMIPQINYYDAFPPSTGQESLDHLPQNNAYYHNQYNLQIFAGQDQNQLSVGDYILAEGYPLLMGKQNQIGNGQRTGGNSMIEKQVYDFSRNYPGGGLGGASGQISAGPSVGNSNYVTRSTLNNTSQQLTQNTQSLFKQGKNAKKNGLGQALHHANTIYGLNGGPAFKSVPYTPARSQSPLRKRNNVYYTSNYQATVQGNAGAQNGTQPPVAQHHRSFPPEVPYTIDELGPQLSQSPQPMKMRHSPYMSDDEYKILHDFYDIQCEPTGLHRGGVPLMRVKRINRPINKKGPFGAQGSGGMYNFADDNNLGGIPKALSSLQIFYPQYQPSPFKQDYLSRTLGTPNKWFDRFYQSTRNLNQTIQNLHKQHSRKLRSYSISSLSSGGNEVPVAGVARINTEQSANQGMMNPGPALFSKQAIVDVDMNGNPIKVKQAMPYEGHPHSSSQEFSSNGKLLGGSGNNGGQNAGIFAGMKGKKAQGKNSQTQMPPLTKKFTLGGNSANTSGVLKGGLKKSKLPPRPKGAVGGGVGSSKHHNNLNSSQGPQNQNMDGTFGANSNSGSGLNNADNQQAPRIINTNHNQYVLLGVSIITK